MNIRDLYTCMGSINERPVYEYPEFYSSQEQIDEMFDDINKASSFNLFEDKSFIAY